MCETDVERLGRCGDTCPQTAASPNLLSPPAVPRHSGRLISLANLSEDVSSKFLNITTYARVRSLFEHPQRTGMPWPGVWPNHFLDP